MCLQYPHLSCDARRKLPLVDLQPGEAAQRENINLRWALLGEETAVHSYNVPGDVTGILRCQKGSWSGQLFRFAHTSEWYSCASLALHLRAQAVRINRAGNKSVHTNAVRGKVECHSPGKGFYAALRCIIGCHPPVRVRGPSTGHVDNDALMTAGHHLGCTE